MSYLSAGAGVLVAQTGPQQVDQPVVLGVERVQVADRVLDRRGRGADPPHAAVPTRLELFELASVALEADIVDLSVSAGRGSSVRREVAERSRRHRKECQRNER